MDISVIIPAYQEQDQIGPCLDSLVRQDIFDSGHAEVEALVVANGCTDETVTRARARIGAAAARGLRLAVVDLRRPGKVHALNVGDRTASGSIRVYLDADVTCEQGVLTQLAQALAPEVPRYASGSLTIPATRSWLCNCYARCWTRLPSVASGVPGCGLYAVNRAGRSRWDEFPDVHSEDKFVRLLFAPEERVRVEARYYWPLPERLTKLLSVRRRWCEGNAELYRVFPEMRARPRVGDLAAYGRLILASPLNAAVFAAVFWLGWALANRGSDRIVWRRGR